jgi:triosephosphate isomerase
MKNIWIIANWKSNKTLSEAMEWMEKVGPNLHVPPHIKVAVCPDFICLEEVSKSVKVGNFPIIVGTQDLSPYPEGAYTGEEPAEAIKGMASLAILGHSERRQNFSETYEMVSQKVEQAKTVGIVPLVCIQNEKTPVPEGVSLVAFEPIEAIGTGVADTPSDAEEVAKVVIDRVGGNIEVLYGGSVNSQNAKAFIQQEHISGLLIGTASLDPEEFLKIVEECNVSS